MQQCFHHLPAATLFFDGNILRGARASSITSGKINKWRRRTQFFAIVGFVVEELHSVDAAVTD